ncbi:MAG: hypothetical protein KDC84_09470 [Crocinitomicaceae bacterium]|nr:hypothetical protein [Crocinitomicaceae bacterium]
MNNILRLIGIYSLPVLFFIIGIWRIIVGLTTEVVTDSAGNEYLIEQNNYEIVAGILCFLISGIILLFITGKLNRKMIFIIGGISVPVAIIVLVMNFMAIKNEVDMLAFRNQVKGEMILRILDIKDAQLAYKTVHGKYCDNMDELIKFVKEGKVPKAVSAGNVPSRRITPIENDSLYPGENRAIDNTMSEMEAWRLSKIAQSLTPEQIEEMNAGKPKDQLSFQDLLEFKRDTIYIPVIEKYFSGEKYAEKRSTIERTFEFKSEFPFNPDSMAVIPHAGDRKPRFGLATGEIFKSTGAAPTLLIWAVHPMDSLQMDSISLGALDKVDFNGSWQ